MKFCVPGRIVSAGTVVKKTLEDGEKIVVSTESLVSTA